MSDETDAPAKEQQPETLHLVLLKELKHSPNDPNPVLALDLCAPDMEAIIAFTDQQNKTKNDAIAGCELIAHCSGVKIALIRKLDARDFKKAVAFIEGFFPEDSPLDIKT